MTEVSIRSATETDAQAVTEVYLASRKPLAAFAPLAHSDEEVGEWLLRELIADDAVTVAIDDGKVVAMMALSDDGVVGWIDQLYVHPLHARRGIGTVLLEHAKSELRSPVRLLTFQENSVAIRFYEKRGFVPIAYSDGVGNEEHCPDVLYQWWE